MKTIVTVLGAVAGIGLMMTTGGCMSPKGTCGDENRFIQKVALPQGGLVVVAEGDYEPRSLGSYSIRLYGASSAEFPFDDFRGGLLRQRPDGFIEKVMLKDLDGDKVDEVVVLFRCVGTGSYLSAEAFHVTGGRLGFAASLSALPPKADALKLLAFKLKPAELGTKEWYEAVEEAIRITDDQGHGPDLGSDEWMHAVDHKVFSDESAKDKTLVVGSRKWMEVVQMIAFR